ncbi:MULTISPECIES: lytic transglycosylase domain-containing protein [unclassified Mesorhizobium]|uniref:lytic transglycosylase domain-containing protein n=1 Tax=unclassified Mesorhizobium TaxID=325217 RepID=UPI0010922386|nr:MULTISPECIES: lytic transglycosylase domain-containing protein [unclassified Mesorhizobium]TGS43719.1 lytic transglycosylase domain-containing protein [Mesorhizobium sp. M8A.F.Ca.ET.182.01.1.1]TGS78300.1 lytic transglycosylase domain-containing protein [Mesorhizobium sp. M8A.F.Ca.ET.181.01.1.1]TGV15439.1 lytic transglycosylase domain-containing protein [Mesorhizobium sp. M8A.F.Ca.ET.173.01.1.1]
MDRVTLLMLGMVAAAPCACSAATGAQPAAISLSPQFGKWQHFVSEASTRFRVPQSWIYAVMEAESGGRTMLRGRPITSHAGAMGLMQVMPETYEEMRDEHGLGTNPYDPRDNTLAGTAYLRAMFDRFGFPGMFAAYNAGPARYDDYLRHGQALPRETVLYLAKLKAAGISSNDMNQFGRKSQTTGTLDIQSGRSLFFFREGIVKTGPAGGILVPLPPHQANSHPSEGR